MHHYLFVCECIEDVHDLNSTIQNITKGKSVPFTTRATPNNFNAVYKIMLAQGLLTPEYVDWPAVFCFNEVGYEGWEHRISVDVNPIDSLLRLYKLETDTYEIIYLKDRHLNLNMSHYKD